MTLTPAELATVIAFAHRVVEGRAVEPRASVQRQFITVCQALVQVTDAIPEKVIRLVPSNSETVERTI